MKASEELPNNYKSWTELYDVIFREDPELLNNAEVLIYVKGNQYKFYVSDIKNKAFDELIKSRFKVSDIRNIEHAIRTSMGYGFDYSIIENMYNTSINDL